VSLINFLLSLFSGLKPLEGILPESARFLILAPLEPLGLTSFASSVLVLVYVGAVAFPWK